MRPRERKARCEHSCAGLFASFLPGPQSEISANSSRGDRVGVRAVDRPSFPQSNPGRGSRRKKKKEKKENSESKGSKKGNTLHAKGPTNRLIRPEK